MVLKDLPPNCRSISAWLKGAKMVWVCAKNIFWSKITVLFPSGYILIRSKFSHLLKLSAEGTEPHPPSGLPLRNQTLPLS